MYFYESTAFIDWETRRKLGNEADNNLEGNHDCKVDDSVLEAFSTRSAGLAVLRRAHRRQKPRGVQSAATQCGALSLFLSSAAIPPDSRCLALR